MKLPRAKVWLAVAGPLLVLLVVLIGWGLQRSALERRIARYRAAGQPTTLAELDAWYTPIPDSENAATALLAAASAWRSTGGTNVPGTRGGPLYPKPGEAWPAALLETARVELVSNAVPLAQIHAALQRPRSRYPGSFKVPPNGTSLADMRVVKQVGQNLGLEARYAAETGDPDRATSALLAMLGVAWTLEEEPLLTSYLLRGQTILISVGTTGRVLSQTALTEEQLRRLQAAFLKAEATNHLMRAMVGERCLVLDTLNWPAAKLAALFSGLPSELPDETPTMLLNLLAKMLPFLYVDCGLKSPDLEFYLEGMDQLTEAATRSRSEMPARQAAFGSYLDGLGTSWRGQLLPQSQELDRRITWLGRLRPLSRQELPNYARVLTAELYWVASLRCAQTAMAVERWRLAHAGALPGSLNELVPQYLSAVPEDPWDDQPLKYHPRSPGYVVYGVGLDGTDDGGTEWGPSLNQPEGWDITFTVAR